MSAQELTGTALRDFLGQSQERNGVQLRSQPPQDMQTQILAAQERLQEKKLRIETALSTKLSRVNVALAVMDKANALKVYRGTSYPAVTQELLDRANEVVLASLADGYYDVDVTTSEPWQEPAA